VKCKLSEIYREKKAEIETRLREFEAFKNAKDEDLFAELCFCILTPQSKAVYADKAIRKLKQSGLLFKGKEQVIRNALKGVRFPNNKAKYLTEARKALTKENRLDIKSRLDKNNISKTRDWLVKNIRGIGYKEASHFLRNIGFGKDIAILDVHILKNLLKYKVIKKLPKTLTKTKYLDIERKLRKFSKKVNIPMAELDLLFWSNETGFVFR